MKKLLFPMIVIFAALLWAGPAYSVSYLHPAVSTVTESIVPDGGNYIYTYTLHNTESLSIWWWGVWFAQDPNTLSESNDHPSWLFNGNQGIYEYSYNPGPGGEPGLLWTWDPSMTSPGEPVLPGGTNVFQFTSALYLPGVKNFFYDTVDYWDGFTSVVAVGQTGSVVPLPATLLLLGPGLVCVAAIRRKFLK